MDAQNLEVLKKILVIQTAFLGDAVLTLPMIQKLKEQFPSSKIYVLCIPSTKELFSKSIDVEKVISYDKKGSQKSIFSFFSLINYLREFMFTRVYSPHRSLRSTLIAFLCGAKQRVGFDRNAFGFLYSSEVTYHSGIHEVARNLELIGMNTQTENWRILPRISSTSKDVSRIQEIFESIKNTKYAAVAPGSVWATKKYPEEYFKQLISYLLSENYFVFLIGGSDDKDFCETILSNYRQDVKNVAGSLGIAESVELLRRCNVLISNDSAPTHLGMIADIPTLTIYCSTVPSFGFYPYNAKGAYVSFDELSCKPCGIHGRKTCPIKTFDCGYKLLPEIVIRKIKEITSA